MQDSVKQRMRKEMEASVYEENEECAKTTHSTLKEEIEGNSLNEEIGDFQQVTVKEEPIFSACLDIKEEDNFDSTENTVQTRSTRYLDHAGRTYEEDLDSFSEKSDQVVEATFDNNNIDSDLCNITRKFRKYECDICKRCYVYRHGLIKHIRKHDITANSFECTKCAKRFYIKDNLRRHLKTHELDERKFMYNCEQCLKCFTRKDTLVLHLKTHSDVKNHECLQCGMKFKLKQHLNTHLLHHKGERNHMCHICSKRFIERRALQRHILIHLGVKKFKCQVCMKSFSRKYDVKIHLQMHFRPE